MPPFALNVPTRKSEISYMNYVTCPLEMDVYLQKVSECWVLDSDVSHLFLFGVAQV